MGLDVDPGLAAVFGSRDRVRTLAVLANANSSVTAYRIAKTAGIKPPNIYRELSRLAAVGEVRRVRTPEGEVGWELADPDLRRLLQKRWRLLWADDLLRDQGEREERIASMFSLAGRASLDLSKYRSKEPVPLAALRRRLEKDRILASRQARTSVRTTGRAR